MAQGRFRSPMLGEVDLSHPTGPDLLAEAILVQLPGLDRSDAQRVQQVGSVGRQHTCGRHLHRVWPVRRRAATR